MSCEFKQITQQWEIDKWNKLFRQDYDGYVAPYVGQIRRILSSSRSKYIRVEHEGEAIGYARLTLRRENVIAGKPAQIWSIEEIFVKSEFRHNGVAASLIAYLRETYDISHIHIQKERAEKLKDFHSRLGFGLIIPHPTDEDMAYVLNTHRPKMQQALRLNADNDNAECERVA